ncbi:Crp/Fnr family transcriptional regulator [Streptomyces massasporeus]|uniref:Crp/Fnr family transcriptional regulator n=1 Tax=Streptomyces massasporeus TaxID=67324 RepID=UPI0037F1D21A
MSHGTFLPASDAGLQQELERLGTRVHFPVDHVLFVEEQPVHSVLIVESGYVAVSHTTKDGSEVVLAFRGPGEPLGLAGALTSGVQGVKARAVSPVTVLDVPSEGIANFIADHGLMPDVLRFFTTRLREADAERSRLARLTVMERFAYFLVGLAAEVGKEVEGHTVIDLPLSQADLAARIGASREATVKTLSFLRKEGVVTTSRRKLVVLDLERLREMAAREL